MNSIRTRGRSFVGTVIAARMQETATVEWTRRRIVRKYQRYEMTRTRIKAHNPPSIAAKQGDVVKIMECTPISKTKHFVIIEKMGSKKMFEAEKELMEQAKKIKAKKQEDESK